MKKTRLFAVLVLVIVTLPLAAQEDKKAQQPQVAYRLLDDFITTQADKEQKDKAVGGTVLTITGGVLLAGAGATALWLDPTWINPSDPSSKWYFVGAAGITGGILTAIGIGALASPLTDYRGQYKSVFSEQDPVVQEALAAATIREIANKGRENRITNGIVNISIPVVAIAAQVIINLATSRNWSTDLGYTFSGYICDAIFGIQSLVVTSPEEQLWDKCLSAKDALYSVPNAQK